MTMRSKSSSSLIAALVAESHGAVTVDEALFDTSCYVDRVEVGVFHYHATDRGLKLLSVTAYSNVRGGRLLARIARARGVPCETSTRLQLSGGF